MHFELQQVLLFVCRRARVLPEYWKIIRRFASNKASKVVNDIINACKRICLSWFLLMEGWMMKQSESVRDMRQRRNIIERFSQCFHLRFCEIYKMYEHFFSWNDNLFYSRFNDSVTTTKDIPSILRFLIYRSDSEILAVVFLNILVMCMFSGLSTVWDPLLISFKIRKDRVDANRIYSWISNHDISF